MIIGTAHSEKRPLRDHLKLKKAITSRVPYMDTKAFLDRIGVSWEVFVEKTSKIEEEAMKVLFGPKNDSCVCFQKGMIAYVFLSDLAFYAFSKGLYSSEQL